MEMKRMATGLVAWSFAAVSMTGLASAQTSASITLTSGEQLSAELMDLSGVGYTMKVNGQERQVPANQVAGIDFTGSSISSSDWGKVNDGPVVVLKSGETVAGQLVDIGGSSPLRLTVRTSSGERDFTSNDVARVLNSRPSNVAASSTPAAAATATATSAGITVDGKTQW